MSKNIKNIVLLGFIFILALVVSFDIINIYKEKRIDTILKVHKNNLEVYYGILKYNQTITADLAYEETIDNKKFISILKKANEAHMKNDTLMLKNYRQEALDLLSKKYSYYKKKGILQYHFVFPDNKVFLRVHKPSKYADDLSLIRSDFDYVNRTLKTIRGFAQGRIAHGFRNIYPIIDQKNKHLASVEISFSSDILQDYFTKVNKIHTHFLVRKDIFDSHTWQRDDLILNYMQSSENKNYMITITKYHSYEKCVKENQKRIANIKDKIEEKMQNNKKFALYTIYKNKARVVSFFPILHSVTKEPVAWIVSYTQDKLVDETIENANILYILTTFILLILFGFIYYILSQKNILDQKVQEKTNNLQKLNKELEESQEQLNIVNESLEHRVQEELQKSREKDKILFEQNKMAALGEMIGNIAHQWRQPLSAISTSVSGMQLKKECQILDDEDFNKTCEAITQNTKYLSKTIDDFRNFIRGDSKKEKFNLKNSIDSFLSLMNSSIKNNQIVVIVNIDEKIQINSLKHELNQSLINIFNNAKDKLIEKSSPRVVKIDAYVQDKELVLSVLDNAGGIDESIMEKIFEPYFTTKHQSQGTGLGLNMTYRLIVEGLHGSISVSNEILRYNDKDYKGAQFTIVIPLK